MRIRRRTKDNLLFGLLILLVLSTLLNAFLFSESIFLNLNPNNDFKLENIIKKSTPAVVSIFSSGKSGSGVIVESNGYILTNEHVISGEKNITILLEDNRIYQAKVIGLDDKTDIALLKIDEENLPTLKFGNSNRLEVGQQVITIGHPFGLAHTVTTGIVSGKHRNRGPTLYKDFIQTDASINPGNSGGPLLNKEGKVIGLNTFIVSDINAGESGFAIPINLVEKIYEQLLEDGEVKRGYFGVNVIDIVNVDNNTREGRIEKGSEIVNVQNESAADKAGLKIGDKIIILNNITIENTNHLRNEIAWISPGEKALVTILRENKQINIEITLDQRPDE
jgi:serine protease Do